MSSIWDDQNFVRWFQWHCPGPLTPEQQDFDATVPEHGEPGPEDQDACGQRYLAGQDHYLQRMHQRYLAEQN
jgi:hypothetical protein